MTFLPPFRFPFCTAVAGAAVLALAGGVAQAETPPMTFPNIEVDCGWHPTCRFHTMDFKDIVNGSLDINWEITCQDGHCPAGPVVLRRGRATIPCGSAETGPMRPAWFLDQIPASPVMPGSRTTLTLTIKSLEWLDWGDEFVDVINRKYGWDSRRYNWDGTYETVRVDVCRKGSYMGLMTDSVGKSDSLAVTH